MEHFYAMILAGGGGTRLWPLSRKKTPKQTLALTEDRTLFRIAVDRLAPLFPPERIFVVSGPRLTPLLRGDALHIPSENFIVEPYARDNAAAVGLGLAAIAAHDPDATIVLLTADHHIASQEAFHNTLRTAYEVAQEGHLVTLGITPTYPSTGFGYIHRGELLREANGLQVYKSQGFKEKPTYETALHFLADGTYSWNSGMFIWHIRKAMQEFERQQPKMYKLLLELKHAFALTDDDTILGEVWEKMPRKSIDYAIMEGATDVAVIPVDIGWSDVGSWSSLYEVLKLDEKGNGIRGSAETLMVDTTQTLVFSDKLTVTIGLDGIVIVDTPDALLVCHRDKAQDIKKVVEHLKVTGQDSYL
ncbi:MAG: sugar phosphate nucleotidyltransferase [Anaerolineae bacterium]|jgi:mannose-1-phosphate guanylyltransferase|nr:sugar phosphate nucleotidyltransferase [Anaerolineae bacterium]